MSSTIGDAAKDDVTKYPVHGRHEWRREAVAYSTACHRSLIDRARSFSFLARRYARLIGVSSAGETG